MKIIYPDYNNSILNLISSMQNVYGVKTDHPEIAQIDSEELKKKKNIVLMIFDGFGYNLFQKYKNTLCPYLAENFVDNITSVFPSTTTSAITSLYTGKSPLEHGALGWSLYFKEYFKLIDFLPNKDTISGEALNKQKLETHDFIEIPNIFTKIMKSDPELNTFYLKPKYLGNSFYSDCMTGGSKPVSFKSTKQLFSQVKKICRKKEKKFIFCYSPFPDSIEHKKGVFAEDVEAFIKEIDFRMKNMVSTLENTTLLITADHGLIDVEKYYYVNEDKELNDSLILPAFPEPRFVSFFVKGHKMKNFEQAIAKYKQDFLILKREDLLAANLFGFGTQNPQIDEFIGDYVAIGISDAAMRPIFSQNGKSKYELTAHHCGLTEAEMVVPLIKIDC